MKKYMLIAMLAAPFALHAEGESGGPKGPKGGFMPEMTDEQKACIEKQGCPKAERPDFKKGEKPKDMTDEEKASMKESRECQKNAFEACGVEMPERTERKGPRKGKGEKQL
jgi:hypothetical protein